MLYETGKRQIKVLKPADKDSKAQAPRRRAGAESGEEDGDSVKCPQCATNTGYFVQWGCCRRRHSHIQKELGVGISVYFKQLKNLLVITFLCTLLSMPAFVLFWSGNILNNPDTNPEGLSLGRFIAAVSLANIGDTVKMLNQLDLNLPRQELDMFCEVGKIGADSAYFLAVPADDGDYEDGTVCGVPFVGVNHQTFDEECYE